MEEIWKSILKYPDYEVSSLGKIRSLKHGKIRVLKQVSVVDKRRSSESHYISVKLYTKGSYRRFLAHRLVAEAFLINSLSLPEVNHKDGIKNHNYIENLEWVTQQENSKHAFYSGLSRFIKNRGRSLSPLAKLTEKEIMEIRELPKCCQKEIGDRYGVSQASISLIQNGKRWG